MHDLIINDFMINSRKNIIKYKKIHKPTNLIRSLLLASHVSKKRMIENEFINNSSHKKLNKKMLFMYKVFLDDTYLKRLWNLQKKIDTPGFYNFDNLVEFKIYYAQNYSVLFNKNHKTYHLYIDRRELSTSKIEFNDYGKMDYIIPVIKIGNKLYSLYCGWDIISMATINPDSKIDNNYIFTNSCISKKRRVINELRINDIAYAYNLALIIIKIKSEYKCYLVPSFGMRWDKMGNECSLKIKKINDREIWICPRSNALNITKYIIEDYDEHKDKIKEYFLINNEQEILKGIELYDYEMINYCGGKQLTQPIKKCGQRIII